MIPILCIFVFVLALIGWWVYNSPVFESERWEKENQKAFTVVRKPEKHNPYKNKALELIKKDILCTIGNRNDYQPKDTKMYKVNLAYFGDTLIQNLATAINEADSVVQERRDEERKAIKIYRSFGDCDGDYKIRASARWSSASSAVRRAEEERRTLIDSLSSIVNEKGQDDNKLGWKVNHTFYIKNGNEDYLGDSYYTYYFDKDCSHILLKVCGGKTLYGEQDFYYWSNDYIERANRLYEESQ